LISKGIILAGGMGTRVGPTTKSISKQLLPIYDKPIIFYSLSILMLMDIKNILIITKAEDASSYYKLLGSGSDFGIKIKYKIQKKPRGLPEAFILGEKFINKKNVALILGDNFFYGQSLVDFLKTEAKNFKYGSKIFTYSVKNPEAYGIIERKYKKIKIVEKPKSSLSNEAITGLYFFDKKVSQLSCKLKPSKRGELEIVDLIKFYQIKNQLKISPLGRGSAWLDTGTSEDILKASNYVSIIENRQNLKIACLEEIAFKKKWITKKQLKLRISYYGKSSYSEYLRNLI
jgi:glucose-1-phosphate thymidylyltransferase